MNPNICACVIFVCVYVDTYIHSKITHAQITQPTKQFYGYFSWTWNGHKWACKPAYLVPVPSHDKLGILGVM